MNYAVQPDLLTQTGKCDLVSNYPGNTSGCRRGSGLFSPARALRASRRAVQKRVTFLNGSGNDSGNVCYWLKRTRSLA